MLLSFSVSNYGSVSSQATLDLTAIKSYHEHDESLVRGRWPGVPAEGVLPALVIYGANGSGKSTVLEALEQLCLMVVDPPMRADEPIEYRPHLGYGEDDRARGTTLAISVLAPGPSSEDGDDRDIARPIRYDYSVTYDGTHIIRESLNAYPKARRQKWLVREGHEIKCGSGLRMGRELRGLVNDNALALSVIANHPNYEGTKRALPVAAWFSRVLMTKAVGSISGWGLAYTGETLLGNRGSDAERTFVRRMLAQSDVGIRETRVVDRELSVEAVERIAKRTGVPPEDVPTVMHEVVFEHGFGDGTADIPAYDESDGTVRIFCASGKIASALEHGGLLIADELDSSLHTSLFEEIVRLFMSPATNPHGAQLLFSAQNPHLLESRILRRDQVWFADKDHAGSTHVYPLSDFGPRQEESVFNGYVLGRYSAVPVIPDLFGLADEGADNGA